MRIAILCLLLITVMLLTSCAGTMGIFSAPDQKIVTVEKAVKVPCLDKSALPTKPVLTSNEVLSTLPDYAFVTVIHLERLKLINYLEITSAVLSECEKSNVELPKNK
jgi:hypothetical protein